MGLTVNPRFEGRDITYYCDDCGEPIYAGDETISPWKAYTELPFDVESANAGESAAICLICDGTRRSYMETN